MEHMVLNAIEVLALGMEGLAALIIGVGVTLATVRLFRVVFDAEQSGSLYFQYKERVAKSLLLGLEVLIAADIVRTIALEQTVENLLALGLLALIRTFLSWSLVVEVDGHWPWQATTNEERR